MRQHLTVAAMFLLAATPTLVQAQPAGGAPPRVEVGVGTATGGWFEAGFAGLFLDLRLTGRLTRRFGAEFVGDLWTGNLSSNRVDAFYLIQGTYLVHESASQRVSVRATFGGLGAFSRHHVKAGRGVGPDGRVYERPARTYGELTGPTEIVGGLAVQTVVARHLAVRGDAQVIVCPHGGGAGIRLAVGASIPLGSYPRGAR